MSGKEVMEKSCYDNMWYEVYFCDVCLQEASKSPMFIDFCSSIVINISGNSYFAPEEKFSPMITTYLTHS